MLFEYDHDLAQEMIHQILYGLSSLCNMDGIDVLAEAYDPEEMTFFELEDSNPAAFKVYDNIMNEILNRCETHEVIPKKDFVDNYPDDADIFFDECDDQIELMLERTKEVMNVYA